MLFGLWLHYSIDLRIQTYTELVPLKYGKLATKYLWIYGFFYSVVSWRGTAAGGDEVGAASAEELAAAAEDEDANQSNADVVDVDKSSKPTSPSGQTPLADDTAADGQ